MRADTGRRIESERRNVLFYGILQKQRFSSRSSFCPSATRSTVSLFSESQNTKIVVSASRSHTSAQIPGGMTSGSPQLRRRLSLSCVRSYSAACCSPFSRIYTARFLWMEYYCRFFLCQRAAPPAQAPEIHKRLRLLMICLFISCLQSCSFHICCLHKNLCPCVATILSPPEIILRLYIK